MGGWVIGREAVVRCAVWPHDQSAAGWLLHYGRLAAAGVTDIKAHRLLRRRAAPGQRAVITPVPAQPGRQLGGDAVPSSAASTAAVSSWALARRGWSLGQGGARHQRLGIPGAGSAGWWATALHNAQPTRSAPCGRQRGARCRWRTGHGQQGAWCPRLPPRRAAAGAAGLWPGPRRGDAQVLGDVQHLGLRRLTRRWQQCAQPPGTLAGGPVARPVLPRYPGPCAVVR